jgi:hypothetical protein
MSARQVPLLDPLPIPLTPLVRYSCKLFVTLAKVKSFVINQLRTLCAKCRGWGVPRQKSSCGIGNLHTFSSRLVCMIVTSRPAPTRSRLSQVTDHESPVTFLSPFIFITLRIARRDVWRAIPLFSERSALPEGGGSKATLGTTRQPSVTSRKFRRFILLQTLCHCEESQLLCNQANPNSFPKIPGVWHPGRFLRDTPGWVGTSSHESGLQEMIGFSTPLWDASHRA